MDEELKAVEPIQVQTRVPPAMFENKNRKEHNNRKINQKEETYSPTKKGLDSVPPSFPLADILILSLLPPSTANSTFLTAASSLNTRARTVPASDAASLI